jgi:hypothetical protein
VKNISLYSIILCLFLAACQGTGVSPQQTPEQSPKHGTRQTPAESADEHDELDRHPSRLIYTKHARCRMGCRHIDESEVREILEEGRINYRKSEPAARPDPKYALEGTTHDGQQVRIIFAPSARGMVVITVIDLDNEWSCHCK